MMIIIIRRRRIRRRRRINSQTLTKLLLLLILLLTSGITIDDGIDCDVNCLSTFFSNKNTLNTANNHTSDNIISIHLMILP